MFDQLKADFRSWQKHRRKIKKRIRKRKRQIQLCVAEYGDHNWRGAHRSAKGRVCTRCKLVDRHWYFGETGIIQDKGI